MVGGGDVVGACMREGAPLNELYIRICGQRVVCARRAVWWELSLERAWCGSGWCRCTSPNVCFLLFTVARQTRQRGPAACLPAPSQPLRFALLLRCCSRTERRDPCEGVEARQQLDADIVQHGILALSREFDCCSGGFDAVGRTGRAVGRTSNSLVAKSINASCTRSSFCCSSLYRSHRMELPPTVGLYLVLLVVDSSDAECQFPGMR